MILAACAQAIVSVIIKSIASSTNISIQVAFYYIVPALAFLPIIFKNGIAVYKTRKFLVHFIRGILSISSVCCFFYSVKYIPLGMSTTLFNMIPFFVPIIANFTLKEKISFKTYLGLCAALPGVLLIINPKFSSFSIIHFIVGLSAAVLMAGSMVLLKYLTREKESINQVVFHQYSSCSLIAILLVGLEAVLNPHSFEFTALHMSITTIFLLLGLGLLSIGIQYCFSKAAQRLPVSQLAPFLYLSVPISTMLGFLLWDQSLSLNMTIGSSLIFAGLCICSLGMGKSLRRSV